MKTDLFDYNLPKQLIAQQPIRPRDHSRLLVFDKKSSQIKHDYFFNLDKYLQTGDILVFNDTKVFPARLWGRRETGGKNEVFLLKSVKGEIWEVLIGGKVRRISMIIKFEKGLQCKVIKKLDNGVWEVRFNKLSKQVLAVANKIGITPTPPYIKKLAKLSDYQTIYAKKVGSVAAPTAGFHFSRRLLAKLRKQGVQFEYVTLHVGYGTFQPVKVNDVKKHKMHAEYAEADKQTAQRLLRAKKEGRRIIAVGTTAVRVLESIMGSRRALARRRLKAGARAPAYPCGGFYGWINTFIYPGYKFEFVDAMVTNFHLPKSTLLMLVAAFLSNHASAGAEACATLGVKSAKRIYKIAIKKKYRFYSFGDGMFIE
jgi:S-adenosylmethionine:tRNA ribosyltransferase-isomerase